MSPQLLSSSSRKVLGVWYGIASSSRLLPASSIAARFVTSNDAGGPQPEVAPVTRRPSDPTKNDESSGKDSSMATMREVFRQRPAATGSKDQRRDYKHRSSRDKPTDHPSIASNGNAVVQRRNQDGNRFDNRRLFVNNNGSGSDNRTVPVIDDGRGPDKRNSNVNRGKNRYSQSYQQRNNGGNGSVATQQSRGDNKLLLKGFIEKLRETARKSPDPSASKEDEKPARIPDFQPRFLRFDNRVGMTPPPPPHFRNRDSNNGREEQSSVGNSLRMPRRDTPQRFTNNNPREYNRPTVRDDMQFLEGRFGRAKREPKAHHQSNNNIPEQKRVVTLPANLPAGGLNLVETSTLFRIKIDDMVKKLEDIGMSTAGKEEKDVSLDIDTLEVLALEFNIETVRGEEDVFRDDQELLMQQRRADDVVTYTPRPPVVCIMGHVDHGKTTLMDALRRKSAGQQNPKTKKSKGSKRNGRASTDVAGTEAGGITQTISAFQVEVEGQDTKVTFLDTPGHAAFKNMRQSGSHAADVIVLVVAADDGVSEQTIEILDFYKSIVKGSNGGITMVVALNKIDKPGIEVAEAQRRIENQLLEQGIICEGMGGESEFGPPVQIIPTSGLTGEGLDELIEGLILQSEIMDLRADHEAHAEGIVMDARMEKGLGVVADCIIRWGSIKRGDCVVSGTQASRVRMLKDVNDNILECGIPSQPVRLVGFKSLPNAGDPIICVDSEEAAEEMVEQRVGRSDDGPEDRIGTSNDVEIHIAGMRKHNAKRVAKFHELAGLEDSDGTVRIPIVVKADADGSLSAVRDALVGLGENSTHKVLVDPVQSGVGEITATDIQMAKESNACIFAFGLKKIDQTMMSLAESEGVIIRSNDIIYSLLDDAREILGRYLPATSYERSHGKGSVQAIFVIDGEQGKEKVAGLKVSEGNLYKSKDSNRVPTHFRVYRDGKLVSPEGQSVTAFSLRHFKKLVDSVRHGDECGLVLSGFDDFQENDEIECYSIEMRTSKL